ncbi:MAG TPA: glycoside hydrolase family 2 TIM barrel-domain containing protein [Candidatus Binataceae bacterium]
MAPRLQIEIVSDRVPGAAPVSANSLFAAVSDASPLRAYVIDKPASASQPAGSTYREVVLDGEWRRRAIAEDSATLPVGSHYNGFDWDRVFVPNNYGLEPSLSAHFGPVYYRCRLAPMASPRCRIEFDAVDYLAGVWLDDEHLGSHQGYFAPFAFDVTGKIEAGSVLTVRVQDPFEDWWSPDKPFFAHAKRAIKGTMKYHDSRPGGLPGRSTPGWTPRIAQSMTTGGITGSVTLRGTGDARIDALFVTPIDPASGLIHLAIVIVNTAASDLEATIGFEISPDADRTELREGWFAARLRPGANRIDARVKIPQPRLWWPVSHSDLGAPELYGIKAGIFIGGNLSDERVTSFGLRTARVESDPRRMILNGRPIFVQAANYIPHQHFANVDVGFYRRDMRLAAEAHLNSFGVHGHLQCPECYDAADREGILIFQDFALQWHYDSGSETNPGFIDNACRQIAEMAYTYWNHPSIVYWACHNEPTAMFIPDRPADEAHDTDNQILDEALERRLRQVEPIRHIHRASGIGDDLHMYDGSLAGASVYGVRMHKSWFVSEYGFWTLGPQSYRWNDQGWPPDSEQMKNWLSRLSFGPATMMFAGLPERYPSFAAWQRATEAYGAFLAKYQTEWMRMNRGAPFYALRWHFFVDWWGWAGGGLLDVDRKPKATYHALKAAMRPVLVATSLDNTVYVPGTELRFPIVGINETRKPVPLDVKWRWRRVPRSLVMGVDTDVNERYIWSKPKPNAMVAVPWSEPSEVLSSGETGGSIAAESASQMAELKLSLPNREFSSAILELEWSGERNWYHVLAAPDGWFCGPAAFVVDAQTIDRLER